VRRRIGTGAPPLAVEAHGQSAVPLLLQEVVRAAIPDLDGSRSVLAGRNHALEVAVLERMVLDVDCKMPLALLQRNAFRHRPARERTSALEPEVVVEAPRGMPLDHEAKLLGVALFGAERLRRLPRIPLPAVLVEAHLWIVARNATRSLPRCCNTRFFPAQTHYQAGDKPVESVESLRPTPGRP